MVSNPAAFHPRSKEQLSSCFITSDIEPTCGTEREPDTISVPKLCQASPEIKALYLKAAEVGHRTPPGRVSNTAAVLLGVVPEHPRQAWRQLQILARLTTDLARALASNDRVTP